ncbi:MAG: asparagine synthase (glutamine-hydrolyzing) [Deltaproteobacteria bacterium]|nr:asparagine synthase (glutamine-hydrolyzing) [Kofleriaceae bacterium]
MCGIVGVIEYRGGRTVDPATLERMNTTLVHRGPDDAGAWSDGAVGIAMRRLSIVDLSGGHQPIENEAGDCRIVFNGEIYNHRVLREELERRGHRFRTSSDTEAILHLYEEEGVAGIARLDGMFALAIVDQRKGRDRPRLVLARDRLGKKPLFYADDGRRLVFGSELKAVLAHGDVSRALDHEALRHYLGLLVVPEPFSIFRAVRKLPGGSTLTCDGSGTRVERYWRHEEIVSEGDADPSRLTSDVRALLFAAVEKRLDLEVPFGAFLSGGLDSGAVVGIMSRVLDRPVKTFSIGFEGPASHNELPGAALTARHFKTEHHELLARPDVVSLIHELVAYADEPLAISSSIPLLLLAREARKQVKVVLTGDGGDEVFGGYAHYRFERWAASWRRIPRFADRVLLPAARAAHRIRSARRVSGRIERFVQNGRRSPGARRLGWASAFSEAEVRALGALTFAPADGSTTAQLLESRLEPYRTLSAEAQSNALDMRVWLPDEMLAKVDRATMAASIEARAPLLDDALVARLASVPFARKIGTRPGAPSKPILREALRDLLPAHLLGGRKWGFNVPLDDWFRGGAASFAAEVLSPERISRRGLFDPAEVSRLLSAHRTGTVNASNRLFALIVFEVWADRYL